MVFFTPYPNTVILLEPYCGTITEPGLPVLHDLFLSQLLNYFGKKKKNLSEWLYQIQRHSLIKNPQNRLVPSFSPDSTLNGQVDFFFTLSG